MMNKVSFEEACNRTAEWLKENGHDPCKESSDAFMKAVDEWCKLNDVKIN